MQFVQQLVHPAFPQEGGPYVWVKLAFGRTAAALTTLFYWVTNPVWLGGSLVFIAAESWDGFVLPLGSGTVADYAFKLPSRTSDSRRRTRRATRCTTRSGTYRSPSGSPG
ncbi:hypothetical protein [Streptomyces sclerotialus]|uniref:hypothetical protein n=1 Tax=Streptomyces sclerotialus TaxID=1957 RepID=UPI0034A2D288